MKAYYHTLSAYTFLVFLTAIQCKSLKAEYGSNQMIGEKEIHKAIDLDNPCTYYSPVSELNWYQLCYARDAECKRFGKGASCVCNDPNKVFDTSPRSYYCKAGACEKGEIGEKFCTKYRQECIPNKHFYAYECGKCLDNKLLYIRNVCIDQCEEDRQGYKECLALNRICLNEENVETKFKCGPCIDEFILDNDQCVEVNEENLCKKHICENGGSCSVINGSAKCVCQKPFTGNRCERIDFCFIHHKNGFSGEEYCENGDAKCISGEHLICKCYNPHRYFDYESGMCINPCTKWPCRNGGTCNFNGNTNWTCECLPHFTGRRCEHVNWCKIKHVGNMTAEDYCSSGGGLCQINGVGKFNCVCENSNMEFSHILKTCVEIDVCNHKGKGFMECSKKNAICRLEDTKSKYTCECTGKKKFNSEGICEDKNTCDQDEKGYKTCRLLKAFCQLDDASEKGFKCVCDKGYIPNNHAKCIEKDICEEKQKGFIECNKRNALCLRNFDNEDGYVCECRPGYRKIANGSCIAITECDEGEIGHKECTIKNALCVRDLSTLKRYYCVCPEEYTENDDGRCQKKYSENYKSDTPEERTDSDSCQEDCSQKNAVCILNLDEPCNCRPGQKQDSEGHCIAINECDKGQVGDRECKQLFGHCVRDKNAKKNYICKCSTGDFDQSGRCIVN